MQMHGRAGGRATWVDNVDGCVCTYKSVGQSCLLVTFPCGLQSTRKEESFYTCLVMCKAERYDDARRLGLQQPHSSSNLPHAMALGGPCELLPERLCSSISALRHVIGRLDTVMQLRCWSFSLPVLVNHLHCTTLTTP